MVLPTLRSQLLHPGDDRQARTNQLPPHCYVAQIEGQTDGIGEYLPCHTATDATLRRQDERTIDRGEAVYTAETKQLSEVAHGNSSWDRTVIDLTVTAHSTSSW